ncbi:MAG: putative Isoquinoline 1-oxidoreductase [Myxococcales bacterium]|nr:putative Isoquinoline 1-oxidoreductase [Myxococcales bacterium]
MLCAMRRVFVAVAIVAAVAVVMRAAMLEAKPTQVAQPTQPVTGARLRGPEAFAGIADPAERSRALFLEASRVLTHPRCINCHPAGDVPHQGMTLELHYPPVVRGPKDRGVVGVECAGCHQDRNLELARVPGAPSWHLAPIEMAWVGKSPRAICEQMQDPKRNGGKTLAQIVEHNAHDKLVAWGWEPGAGREPVPGTQEQFGRLVAAWVETGAKCPPEEARP